MFPLRLPTWSQFSLTWPSSEFQLPAGAHAPTATRQSRVHTCTRAWLPVYSFSALQRHLPCGTSWGILLSTLATVPRGLVYTTAHSLLPYRYFTVALLGTLPRSRLLNTVPPYSVQKIRKKNKISKKPQSPNLPHRRPHPEVPRAVTHRAPTQPHPATARDPAASRGTRAYGHKAI